MLSWKVFQDFNKTFPFQISLVSHVSSLRLFLRIHHTKPLTSSSLTSDEDGLASAGGDATRSSEKRLRFICVDIMSSNEAFAAVDEE